VSGKELLKYACKILDKNPERKEPLARPRHKCENNIKIDINAIEFEHVDWIYVVVDRAKRCLISAW
jgi:hypothetical protein